MKIFNACNEITIHTEAPAVIKRGGVYHLLGSGSSGWKPNAARYFTTLRPFLSPSFLNAERVKYSQEIWQMMNL